MASPQRTAQLSFLTLCLFSTMAWCDDDEGRFSPYDPGDDDREGPIGGAYGELHDGHWDTYYQMLEHDNPDHPDDPDGIWRSCSPSPSPSPVPSPSPSPAPSPTPSDDDPDGDTPLPPPVVSSSRCPQ